MAGSIYLLWLAYGSARSAMRADIEKLGSGFQAQSRESRLFVRGVVLNLSNPKAVVAWMAALSVGLGADDSFVSVIAATFGCAFINHDWLRKVPSLDRWNGCGALCYCKTRTYPVSAHTHLT